ncbi:copper homeostasis protein CutC [Corynebacterium mendelii]|uniref:PF03932 family protein CutC n=1 Tax=Corynebacterium mendelii TaxID=2765362 RepID=A0A939DXR9_9CORY|nr:copper homeostasis protein CutC [Corynebacterium mendelii]MBN9643179.1 copper homeostasis protein CutC [Corynebacterium mendelii]
MGSFRTKLEVAVQDAAGARVAKQAGADRVELAAALALTGGLTPTLPVVKAAVATGIDVHVLIRCRPGGFIYTDEEIAIMCQEITDCVDAGCAGVVCGAASPDGTVNIAAMGAMVAAARGLDVTVHRVIDTVDDRLAAIDAVADIGVARILTSAGAAGACDDPQAMAEMVARANRHGIGIQAGGSIRPATVGALKDTGICAVHASCSGQGPDTGPTGPGGGSVSTTITDAAAVRELAEIVHSW